MNSEHAQIEVMGGSAKDLLVANWHDVGDEDVRAALARWYETGKRGKTVLLSLDSLPAVTMFFSLTRVAIEIAVESRLFVVSETLPPVVGMLDSWEVHRYKELFDTGLIVHIPETAPLAWTDDLVLRFLGYDEV